MPRKGENIFHRKDGRWEARYIARYEGGRARYRSVYALTYAEAKQKRAQESADLHAGVRGPSFPALAEAYLSAIQSHVKESTYTRYRRNVDRYLIPRLGNQNPARIGAAALARLPQELLTSGGAQGGPLSPKTVTDLLCLLKAIFRFGRACGWACPPAGGLKPPPRAGKAPQILCLEDQIRLEEQLLHSEDETSLGILFTLFTGLRIGELCGLKWGDLDFDAGTVTVRRTVERIADLDPHTAAKTKVVLSAPKTASSFRVIPLPGFLLEYMAAHRRREGDYLLTGGPDYTEPHQFYIRYRKYLLRAGVGPYTFHALRHTFATACVEKGFDVKSLSEILGHASVSTTLSIYVHPSLRAKKRQMDLLSPVSRP